MQWHLYCFRHNAAACIAQANTAIRAWVTPHDISKGPSSGHPSSDIHIPFAGICLNPTPSAGVCLFINDHFLEWCVFNILLGP
jgi:hypothetical protein